MITILNHLEGVHLAHDSISPIGSLSLQISWWEEPGRAPVADLERCGLLMLDLVVVVADTTTEHAEYYSDDYDDSASHWTCQIPLVLMNDLILCLSRPIVNVVVS